jgi:deazaflavin-dependent oxidoreductase (nitroreductase family)
VRHAISVAVVALFALVFMHGAWVLRLLNPLFIRYLAVGLPGGPNVLLTVRGRSTGRPRRAPVALLELGDRRFVQAAFGEVSWVWNLRASGQAVVRKGRRSETLDAVELDPAIAGSLMCQAVAPFRRSRLLRAVVGPTTRPPIGVLHYFGVRIDQTASEYIADARRHPVFELIADASTKAEPANSDQLATGDGREADRIGDFDLLVGRGDDPLGSQSAQDARDDLA